MPKRQVMDIRPRGWETDPSDEFLKLAPLDYCVDQVNLSQCRQLCGHIEEHPEGGLCFHKKRESSVELHVQWLDGLEDEGKYPTFDDLEKGHFTGSTLGKLDTLCVAPMTYGEKPEAQPTSKPKASAFKINFIRGGMVFMMHNHHYCNDISGWAGEMHQLAENCAAVWKSPKNRSYPPWDPACLDYSGISRPSPEQLVEGTTSPPKHPDHVPGEWLLFHLPKSKAAALKRLASPDDEKDWISSYDAYTAYMWRILSKHRAQLFKPDLSKTLLWGEAVNMRTRCHNPPVAERIQGNVVYVPLSMTTPVSQFTTAEVISDAPFSKLAWYNRQLTKSATQENLNATLTQIAAIRDKTSLFLRMDSFPPMSNITTDWRDSNPYDADFGFAKPYAFSHPFDTASNGYIIIYPTRQIGAPAGEDEGNEILIGFEKELTKGLLEDYEWNKYFEFRGYDGVE
ncbi:hypothetical protein LQW54_002096 [Pestalotiopsis sp. IQ-011]